MRQASERLRKRCLSCGEQYEAYREWQKFCSPGCRKRDYQARAHEIAVDRILAELERQLPKALAATIERWVDLTVCMVRSEVYDSTWKMTDE